MKTKTGAGLAGGTPSPDQIGELESLGIWRDGIALARTIHRLSARWPKTEMYGLVSQARRAAVSYPTNLAEGIGRNSSAEIARFASIAQGSLYELTTLLRLAEEFTYPIDPPVVEIRATIASLVRRTHAFISYHTKRAR